MLIMKYIIKYSLAVFALFSLVFSTSSFAQNGEALFKAKCNACHIMGKDGTGPDLQGVKAKWVGEEDFLYEWVLNSPKVIAEGKSQRALEMKDWSPTAMPAQDVTLEEAKAIIDWADSWEAPIVEKEVASNTEIVVHIPDYKNNLTLFYILLLVIFLLLISILVVSKSTSAIIKSEVFKKKLIERNNKGGTVLKALGLMIFTLGFSKTSSALSLDVPAHAEAKNLWLYVENSDLYVLLLIALLLLGFLMHSVNMFFGMLRIIKPKRKKAVTKESEVNTFTRILTGAVPIEEEHTIDLGHDYDGIRELDNPMPPWWLAGFFISIVFAVVYMFHYHVLGTGDLQHEEYEKSVAAAEIEVKEYLSKMAMNVDETNATMMTDPANLKKGKELFINNCAVCHKEHGGGEVGPNLTDDYWVYGGDIKDIYKIIRKGAPNGMPEHQSKFNPIQIQQVSSYVLTLEYVSPEDGGKEPEGDLYTPVEETLEEVENIQREELQEEIEDKLEELTE